MPVIPREETPIADKVYNLYVELCRAKRDKKDVVKAHNENIKRIEDEIKEVIDEHEEEILAAQEQAAQLEK